MGSYGQRVNLKQYRRLDGKWQFVPVVKVDGKPNPRLILIHGAPASSKGGDFYLDWRENGKRMRRQVGASPRDALDAWRRQRLVQMGAIEANEEPLGPAGASPSMRRSNGIWLIFGLRKAHVRTKSTAASSPGFKRTRPRGWFQNSTARTP
jgi:hypothetical protein